MIANSWKGEKSHSVCQLKAKGYYIILSAAVLCVNSFCLTVSMSPIAH